MKDKDDNKSLGDCYFCGESKGLWCKICREVLCTECHKQREEMWFESEWLSPHQYYDSEFLGMIRLEDEEHCSNSICCGGMTQ